MVKLVIVKEVFFQNEFTIPDLLKNVAWHKSNHFGGKKIEKQVALLGFELTTFKLDFESAMDPS